MMQLLFYRVFETRRVIMRYSGEGGKKLLLFTSQPGINSAQTKQWASEAEDSEEPMPCSDAAK